MEAVIQDKIILLRFIGTFDTLNHSLLLEMLSTCGFGFDAD